MEKSLYVGNLVSGIKEDDLKRLFQQTGTVVSVRIIKDRYTGQSRGFGFVEMANPQEAQDAIKQFDGFLLEGQNIRVNEARPRVRDDRGTRREDRGGGFRRSRW